MKLTEILTKHELDITIPQIKAFFLGVNSADKPLPFPKALDELLDESVHLKDELEGPLKELWDEIIKNYKTEMGNLLPVDEELSLFLEAAILRLDYFLTGMGLAGTSSENAKDPAVAEFIEEIEDAIETIDEILSEEKLDKEDAEDMREFLLGAWEEFSSR